MPTYLTPARYRTMGFGLDLSEVTEIELASLCNQASAIVNSYCLAPRLPQEHDFRGGVVTGERHQWRYPETPFDIGQRRAYPFHWPIVNIDQFRIHVTNTQYVGIQPPDLFINNTLRYAEVVSLALTSAGLFNALIVPNIGLATPVVTLNYRYGWNFHTKETLIADDGQTFRAQNQWWFSDVVATDPYGYPHGGEPTITVNGSPATNFTINYNEGTVTFSSELDKDDVVEADYYYKLPSEIMWATGHIVRHLHASAEQYARGMGKLGRLQIGEVEMESPRFRSGDTEMMANLDVFVPEAANLLSSYRFDNAAVRG